MEVAWRYTKEEIAAWRAKQEEVPPPALLSAPSPSQPIISSRRSEGHGVTVLAQDLYARPHPP